MKWFGESWHAPICEPSEHVERPIGRCMYCDVKLKDGDRGVAMPTILELGAEPVWLFAHIDCFLRALGLGPVAAQVEEERKRRKLDRLFGPEFEESDPATWDAVDYNEAMTELERLMPLDPDRGTPEAARLQTLAQAIEAYEQIHYPIGGKPARPDVVHILSQGFPLCGFSEDIPAQWPVGHRWTSVMDWDAATCDQCRALYRREVPL